MRLKSLVLTMCLAELGNPGSAQAPAFPEVPIVIRNGTLIDGTGAAPVPDVVLVIQGERIVSAGPRSSTPVPAGANVLDAGGGTILPGFINAHVHFGFDEKNLKAWAEGGVTTVRDESTVPGGRSLRELLAFRDRARANPALARLISAGTMLCAPGGYGSLTVTSPEDARAKVREELEAGADLVKVALEDGYAGQSGLPNLTKEELQAIVAEAHAHGAGVSAHLTQGRYAAALVEAGVDDLAHTAYTWIPDDVLEQMVKQRVSLVPTFTVFRNYGAPLGPCLANVRRFAAAGGRIAVGNDFGGGPGEFEPGIPMFELTCLVQAGLTPMQVIEASTRNAAQVLRLDATLGTLEAGKQADILIVKGDPLKDLAALKAIRFVLHGGRIIRDTP